jgi:hypothetical protein
MTDHLEKQPRTLERAAQNEEGPDEGQAYLYQHAGIRERDGRIPFWLTLVVFGLLIWSIYYLIRYWSAE